MIATVTLNPSVDQFFEVHDLGKKDVCRAVAIRRVPAGKGINVSKFLLKLGARTRAYVLLGGAVGNEYARLAAEEKLPLEICPVRGDTRINVIINDLESGREIRVLAPGPRVAGADSRSLEKKVLGARREFFALVLSGSLPPGLRPGTYAEWVRRFRKAGVRCLLDAEGEALRQGVRALPWAIKPNQFEMEDLSRRRLRTEKKLLHAALSLVEGGIEMVAVSVERRGVLVASRTEQPFFVRPPHVRVRSRVGAGDALVAGLVRGLERGMPLAEAARLGTAVSSAAVAGIERSFRQEVRRLAGGSKVEWVNA